MNLQDATPLGNQSPLKHAIWCKNDGDTPKTVLQSLARNQKLKKFFKTFEHTSPLCRGDPTGPIFTIFGVWSRIPDKSTVPNFKSIAPGVTEFGQMQGFWGPKIGSFPLTFIVLRTTVLHCDYKRPHITA